jgi:hypothetical protein
MTKEEDNDVTDSIEVSWVIDIAEEGFELLQTLNWLWNTLIILSQFHSNLSHKFRGFYDWRHSDFQFFLPLRPCKFQVFCSECANENRTGDVDIIPTKLSWEQVRNLLSSQVDLSQKFAVGSLIKATQPWYNLMYLSSSAGGNLSKALLIISNLSCSFAVDALSNGENSIQRQIFNSSCNYVSVYMQRKRKKAKMQEILKVLHASSRGGIWAKLWLHIVDKAINSTKSRANLIIVSTENFLLVNVFDK